MTARLPTPGGDDNTWGDVLNSFLEVSLAPDGTLNNNVVGTSQLQNNCVTNAQLDSSTQTIIASVASKYVKPAGGIPSTDLSSGVQANLTAASTAIQASQLGAASGVATLDSGSHLTGSQLPSSVVNATHLVFNVKDYGAVVDGSTDDTTAIQSAINAAAAAGGGRIYIPSGTTVVSGLVMQNCTWLDGQGMHATTIKLKNGSNTSVITNYVSPDGIIANAEFVAVTNLMIDGNKTNQTTTSHGIYFTSNPTQTHATNDLDFDTHQRVENVEIYNCHDDGFSASSRSSMVLLNVYTFKCDGNGFSSTYDTDYESCVSGWAGINGFYINNSSVRLAACKAFYSGQVSVGPAAGIGIYITSGQGGVSLSSCEAQDNRGSGYVLNDASRVTMVGCVADSNSTSSAGTYPGLDLWSTTFSTIKGFIAYERKANGTNSYQTNALRIRSNSTSNRIELTHSAANGATIGSAITSSSTSVIGNTIEIDAQNGTQTITYASSITPDPYLGSTAFITLTGNLTMNAPANAHAGCLLSFVVTQDATGGRTVAWNAIFKVPSWNPDTTANAINTVQFVYDGSAWQQVSPPSTSTGRPMSLTGATAASRYVGATASGAPTSGTFAIGDFVIDQTGIVWVCIVAGTPGIWNSPTIAYPGYSSTLLENIPRYNASGQAGIVNSTVFASLFIPNRNFLASNIVTGCYTALTGSSTLSKMALFSVSGTTLTCIARTASDTTLWTSATTYSRAIVDNGQGSSISSLQLNAGTSYAVGMLVIGTTTTPKLDGVFMGSSAFAAGTNLGAGTPPISFESPGSQTDIPTSFTSSQAAGGNFHWVGCT